MLPSTIHKKVLLSLLFAQFCLISLPISARSEEEDEILVSPSVSNSSIILANTIVRPEAVEKAIRTAIGAAMKGDRDGTSLVLKVTQLNEEIDLPEPKGDLAQILEILGIKKNVDIEIAPFDADFVLPASHLKLSVKPTEANHFAVKAQWKITKLTAKSKNLSMLVPKGLFGRPFQINSSPIEIGLEETSEPIYVSLELETDFTPNGAKVNLKSFKTNLNSKTNSPDLYVKLGPLTENKKPLVIDFSSGPNSLHAEEYEIRQQLKQIEPSIIKSIKKRLEEVVQSEFTKISKKIINEPPFKFSIDSNKILPTRAPTTPAQKKNYDTLRTLFHDINLDLTFSYLQYMERLRLFSAQIASRICFGKECLYNTGPASSISTEDLQSITKNEDIGVMIYESWIQSFIHSEQFQARIKEFYKKSESSSGVEIGKDGVRIHFNPKLNALIAVLNIKIDVKKTSKLESGFGKWINAQIGGFWEYVRGTGKFVILPVEIVANLGEIEKDADGKLMLTLNTHIPIGTGTVQNTYHYPDNSELMTSLVRKPLLDKVTKEVEKIIPKEIKIPLDYLNTIQNYHLIPKKAVITPNRGLLITGEMKE